jgi:hypothetical protein
LRFKYIQSSRKSKAMKTICKSLFVVILIINTSLSFAQVTDRTKHLFSNSPASIHCDESVLSKLFQYTEGNYASIDLPGLRFSGSVLSNVKKYDNLYSVAIQSIQHDNAILLLSKQINKDQSITYTGRIMHPNSKDGYEIKRDEKGNYFFKKFDAENILQKCL